MNIMKKDVNFIFFILIIATVVSFAGFTAYYQVSFGNINAEYDTKLTELKKVTDDLLAKKLALTEATTELDTTKKGREELGEKYNDIRDERDSLKTERDTLKENLYKTTADLVQKTTQVESLSTQLVAEQKRSSDLKIDRDYYKNKYEGCDDAATT